MLQFLMVAAMHFPSGSSNLEKLRYWWWIMLFTDENSFLTSDKTTPLISREDVVKLATGDNLKTGKNAADVCVPLETIGRFLRDLMSSCAGLKIASGMEVSERASSCGESKSDAQGGNRNGEGERRGRGAVAEEKGDRYGNVV